MIQSFCRTVLRFRWPILLGLVVAAIFMGNSARKVQVRSLVTDVFPSTHPYVQTFLKYSDVFGGASKVLVAVEVEHGDIWNRGTLQKVQRITRGLEQMRGINNYQVISLASKKVKIARADPDVGMHSVPVMWPDVPRTDEELKALRRTVLSSRRIYGALVSMDEKATLVAGGFFEESMQPKEIYQALDAIIERESDPNTRIHVIGRPMFLGDIAVKSPRLGLIMLATIVAMLSVLAVYFRTYVGVVVPAAAALFSATMGIGFLGLTKQNFDPLVLVIPFVITARALSHSVQFVSRFLDEHEADHDGRRAAIVTASALFKPGAIAILTDITGIALVYIAPIPLMQKLALMGAFWLMSIFFSGMVLSPILLSLIPVPKRRRVKTSTLVVRLLGGLSRLCTGRARRWVFASVLIATAASFLLARSLVVGDVHPGTPLLWPDSRYNLDTDAVAQKFTNTEELSVVVEGDSHDAIKRPEILASIVAFQRHMEALPEVGATASIADLLPGIVSLFHGLDPKFELIPNNPKQAAFFLEMIYQGSQPGDLVRYVTPDSRNANIALFLRDHKGETLRKVIRHAKAFIQRRRMKGGRFRLAGGYGGLLAAINEEVTMLDTRITLAAFCSVFFCCLFAYRSGVGGLLFLVPLILSNSMTYALMGALRIGLDVNALPVVALGVGLGVDYGLYVVENVEEAHRRGLNVVDSVRCGVMGAGKGVFVTGMTMAAGLGFWRLSFLRFQAEMGMLLLFWMTISMLGSLILVPALLVQFRPSFVFRGASVDEPSVT